MQATDHWAKHKREAVVRRHLQTQIESLTQDEREGFSQGSDDLRCAGERVKANLGMALAFQQLLYASKTVDKGWIGE